MDPEIKALLSILLESETRLTNRLSDLAQTVENYVKASNERIVLVEKQLDAFLRAIRPQPNGKSEAE